MEKEVRSMTKTKKKIKKVKKNEMKKVKGGTAAGPKLRTPLHDRVIVKRV
jgi:hypothetical protein